MAQDVERVRVVVVARRQDLDRRRRRGAAGAGRAARRSTRASTACSASFGPIARAASSPLAPSGSSSAVPSGSVTFTSGQDSRSPDAPLRREAQPAWCLCTGPCRSSKACISRRSSSFNLAFSSSSERARDERLLLAPGRRPSRPRAPGRRRSARRSRPGGRPGRRVGGRALAAPCCRAGSSSRRSRDPAASRASRACRGTAGRLPQVAHEPAIRRGSGRSRSSVSRTERSRWRSSLWIRSTIPSVSRSSDGSSRPQTSRLLVDRVGLRGRALCRHAADPPSQRLLTSSFVVVYLHHE